MQALNNFSSVTFRDGGSDDHPGWVEMLLPMHEGFLDEALSSKLQHIRD